jgi:hypothetical protein
MKNSFDAPHIAFVHRKAFGNVGRRRTDGHREIETRAYGFDTVNETPVKVRGELAHRAVYTNSTDLVCRVFDGHPTFDRAAETVLTWLRAGALDRLADWR